MENKTHVKNAVTESTEVQKSPFKRFLAVFLADDIDSVKDSIVDDYIKPRMTDFKKDAIRKFKEFVVDSVQGCVEMVILGTTSKKNHSGYYKGNKVQYYSIYDGKSSDRKESREAVDEKFALKLYSIEDYAEAKEVLNDLRDIIDRYQHATVADYYMLVHQNPRACDNEYGWFDLEDVEIYGRSGKYVIDLPKPEPMTR